MPLNSTLEFKCPNCTTDLLFENAGGVRWQTVTVTEEATRTKWGVFPYYLVTVRCWSCGWESDAAKVDNPVEKEVVSADGSVHGPDYSIPAPDSTEENLAANIARDDERRAKDAEPTP